MSKINSFSVVDILAILRQHTKIILYAGIAGAVVALLTAYSLPQRYGYWGLMRSGQLMKTSGLIEPLAIPTEIQDFIMLVFGNDSSVRRGSEAYVQSTAAHRSTDVTAFFETTVYAPSLQEAKTEIETVLTALRKKYQPRLDEFIEAMNRKKRDLANQRAVNQGYLDWIDTKLKQTKSGPDFAIQFLLRKDLANQLDHLDSQLGELTRSLSPDATFNFNFSDLRPVSLSPILPKRTKIIVLGVLFGLISGCFTGFFLELKRLK